MPMSRSHDAIPRVIGYLVQVAILLLGWWTSALAGELSRLRLKEDGEEIVITYNLAGPKTGFKQNFDVSLTAATFVDSIAHRVVPRTVAGDLGRGLDPARGHTVRWGILDDFDHYDMSGDVEVTLSATVNRWALRSFRRTRVGIEFVTDLLYEVDVRFRGEDSRTADRKFEFNESDFSLSNSSVRAFASYLFPSGRSAEVGFTFGRHPSSISSADTAAILPEAHSYVLDGRVLFSGVWLGLGVGKYSFGDAFDELTRDASGPKYWYYEFSLGGKLRLGRGGSLIAEFHHGRQIAGDLPDGGDVLVNVRALRAGYSADLMDFWSLFVKDDWEPLPPEQIMETARLEDVQVRRHLPLPEVPGLSFVYVPSGTYFVGTPTTEKLRDGRSEVAPFPLYVDGFYVSTTEVTQEAYQKYVEREWTGYQGPDHPAHSVDYDEAAAFCGLLTGADRYFDYSLPTEGEWEIACRGGLHPDEGPIASADAKERARIAESRDAGEFALMRYGWFRSNKPSSGPQPVQEKKSNIDGLYDMHGNVAEWCRRGPLLTWKNDLPGRQPIRGGSITSEYARCRAGARALEPADSRKPSIGFRIVCRPSR
jgi:formylglycine-generating enzyme required for sulfatase activity